jgi:hypothetical protein
VCEPPDQEKSEAEPSHRPGARQHKTFREELARASSRLERFTPAMSRTTPTAHHNAISERRSLPVT